MLQIAFQLDTSDVRVSPKESLEQQQDALKAGWLAGVMLLTFELLVPLSRTPV